MKQPYTFLIIISVGMVVYVLFGASCLPNTSYSVRGMLFGKPMETRVDHELAGLMLSFPNDMRVQHLFQTYQDNVLNTETLAELTNAYSLDVATLYFLQRAYRTAQNKKAQDDYIHYFKMQQANSKPDLALLESHYVVFIPGLAYKEDTTTGANFARQQRLLTSLGISNELIEIDEWGLADENAQFISDRLKALSQQYNKIMVVSASKGGLETAITLGKMLTPAETQSIKSWVSVGGILRGSPIADHYLTAPKCWFAEFMLWTKKKKIDVVRDMSYQSRAKEFSKLEFPPHLKIIHFVGAPLSTQLDKKIKGRYCSMKSFGPNDGLTPLADQLTENGIIISEIGLDHYFRDIHIDQKTLALALVAAQHDLSN